MPRSIGHTRWCVHIWEGWQRPWSQHHKLVQHSLKRRTHFQQQQMLHQTRLCDILWWCVLSQWILTRSTKDSRHHRDDTPSNEAGTAVILRSSKLPSDIWPPPQSSHRIAMCTLQKGEQLQMGWELKHKLPGFQKIKSLLQKSLLKPLRYYNTNRPVTLQCDASLKGFKACIIHEGHPIAFVSKSLTDTETWYANTGKKPPCHHIRLWEVPHLPVWKNIYGWNRPLTTGDDKHEESYCSPS